MIKRCLIIDNEDQSASIETVMREGRKQGVIIECEEFRVGSIERNDLFTNDAIDLAKVENAFKTEFGGKHFDLIAFDWNLDDAEINGIELIRYFQNIKLRRSTPKILYSGILKEEIQSLFDKYQKKEIDKARVWNQISTLIQVDIKKFSDRGQYENAIIEIIKETTPSFDAILNKELLNYPDYKISGVFPQFNNLTLKEIVHVIEKDASIALKFKTELIEQIIAYLISVDGSASK